MSSELPSSGRKRLTLDDQGYLTTADGRIIGRLVNLTIDFGQRGDKGGSREELQTSEKGEEGVQGEERDSAALVWEAYVRTMQPRRKELDPQSRSVIRDALKVASEEECIQAIEGCASSAHHMGQNDRGKKYNTLSHILRGKRGIRTTREQIDLMLSYRERPDVQRHALSDRVIPSGEAADISQAKRTVREKVVFNDSNAQAMAKEAMELLRKHGIETAVTLTPLPNGGQRTTVRFSDEATA